MNAGLRNQDECLLISSIHHKPRGVKYSVPAQVSSEIVKMSSNKNIVLCNFLGLNIFCNFRYSVLQLRGMYKVHQFKSQSDPQHSGLYFLYDAAQETGSSSTGSDSTTREQSMREWFSCNYHSK